MFFPLTAAPSIVPNDNIVTTLMYPELPQDDVILNMSIVSEYS